VEFATKNVLMKDGATVKAQLWDTSGQEKYKAITVAHYRKALGALVCYDLTRRRTWENVKHWLDSIMQQAESNIVIMLVGNKLDLVQKDEKLRQVSQDEPRKLCEQFSNVNMKFIETSTIEKINVQEAFETLLQEIYLQR
jgi:small GTP-binding protein